jgi:hypothetical protein
VGWVPRGGSAERAGTARPEWPPITKGLSPRWFVLFGALCFLGSGIWIAFDAIDPLGRWSEAHGVVAEVVSEASDGDTLIVRFAASDGTVVRFWGSADKVTGHYAVGEQVPVSYRKSAVRDAHIEASSTRSVVAVLMCVAAAIGCALLARAKKLHWTGL